MSKDGPSQIIAASSSVTFFNSESIPVKLVVTLPCSTPPAGSILPSSNFSSLPSTISCSSCSCGSAPASPSLQEDFLFFQTIARRASIRTIPVMAKPVSKLLPLEPAVENLEADLSELEAEQRRRAERTTPSRTFWSCDKCCEEPL